MPTKTGSAPKTTPAPKTVAEFAVLAAKLPNPKQQFASGQALVNAVHPGCAKTLGTQVRGVLRDDAKGVGRGKRHTVSPAEWLAAYKRVQASKEQARNEAKAARAADKAKASEGAKATAKA